MNDDNPRISGIVVAAGESVRMGQPKMVLPWGSTTVIGKVVSILQQVHLDEIIVVTGGWRKEVENALRDYCVRTIYNSEYLEGEMLSSVKKGIEGLSDSSDAALITLGDMPYIKFEVVRSILETYISSRSMLVVPSYQMRRGHPWLVANKLWEEILELKKFHSLRYFLNKNQNLIKYVSVNTNSIILDLDTPTDYASNKPGS